MNNQTFSIFESDNYKDMVFECKLERIQVESSELPGCIEVYDGSKKDRKVLCSMMNQ
jgi:hypothetical protein